MRSKPNSRNWNDVQIAIATTAIVTTLGMWNLFAAPAKTVTAKKTEPTPPPTEPPVTPEPTAMPYVKIMFIQAAPQSTVVQQPQQQTKKKKKKKDNNNNNGGSASVTQTQSS